MDVPDRRGRSGAEDQRREDLSPGTQHKEGSGNVIESTAYVEVLALADSPASRDINQDLSQYLDYLLDHLEPERQSTSEPFTQVKEESPEPSVMLPRAFPVNGHRIDLAGRHDDLLRQLNSGNRQKLELIREACAMAVSIQTIRQAAGKDEGVGEEQEMVIMPRVWVQETMELLRESAGCI